MYEADACNVFLPLPPADWLLTLVVAVMLSFLFLFEEGLMGHDAWRGQETSKILLLAFDSLVCRVVCYLHAEKMENPYPESSYLGIL